MQAAFLGILAVYIGTNTYIAARLWKWLGLAVKWGGWIWGAAFAMLASAFFVSELWPRLPDGVARPLNIVGGWYLAAYIFLLILVPVCDIATRGKGGSMAALIILAAAMIITAVGAMTASQIRTKQYTVSADVSSDRKIALVSDLHIGEIIQEKQLSKMVEAINAIDADYVLIAGDIFDAGPAAVRNKEAVGSLISQIQSKNGVYACLGNHDGGFRGQEAEAIELLGTWGVTVLSDQRAELGDMIIAGRKDRGTGRMSAQELLEGVDDRFTILLDHQPFEFDEEKAAGADLILSGHTHRGQIFPGNLITKAIYKLDYGILTEDDCTMIVSSGAGTWGPRVRIGSQSEVVEIDIVSTRNQ